MKVLLSKPRTIFRDSHGSQVAELALVLPILLMVFMGILWFGRAFNIYTTLNRAARDGAQAAAAHTCGSCGNAPAVDTDVQTNIINPIIIAAHLDPSQLAVDPVQHVETTPSTTPKTFVAIVSMRYPYSFTLNGVTCCPFSLAPIRLGVTIAATSQAREEQ